MSFAATCAVKTRLLCFNIHDASHVIPTFLRVVQVHSSQSTNINALNSVGAVWEFSRAIFYFIFLDEFPSIEF